MILIVFYFLLALSAVFFKKLKKTYIDKLKFSSIDKEISVIIPVRNEQERIKIILNALEKQNYKNFEVIIADDGSSDLTYNNLLEFTNRNSNFKIIKIEKSINNLSRKQNALHQLIEKAENDIIFSTDAGCYLNENFLRDLSNHFTNEVDMILCQTCTLNAKDNLISKFQVFVERILSSFFMFGAIFNKAFAGKGSGIALRKSTYISIGGYSQIGHSIIEDEALVNFFQSKRKKIIAGFNLLVKKQIKDNFGDVLKQHRRWIRGALNSYISISFLLVLFYYTSSIYFIYKILFSFKVYLIFKYILEYIFITSIYSEIEEKYSLKNRILITALAPLYFILVTTYALLPTRIKWK